MALDGRPFASTKSNPSPEPTPEPEPEPEPDPDRNANPEPGQALCQHYLQKRKTLKLVVVLVDGRTGLKRNDLQAA